MSINNRNYLGKKSLKIDYSGLGILFGITVQAFALIPLIVRVHKTKSAEEISYFTPIMFLFAFILFSVISLSKEYYLPLIVFLVGIVASTMLLVQKIIYEREKLERKMAPVFDLNNVKLDFAPSSAPSLSPGLFPTISPSLSSAPQNMMLPSSSMMPTTTSASISSSPRTMTLPPLPGVPPRNMMMPPPGMAPPTNMMMPPPGVAPPRNMMMPPPGVAPPRNTMMPPPGVAPTNMMMPPPGNMMPTSMPPAMPSQLRR